MEKYGPIVRKEYPQVPPKVEYTLSEIGREFIPTLRCFHDFGEEYIEYLDKGEKAQRNTRRHSFLAAPPDVMCARRNIFLAGERPGSAWYRTSSVGCVSYPPCL